jgi:hypothetical protein
MRFRKGPHAGRYAEQRYQEGLRSWRRTNRWLFVGFCGPFVAIGIAAYAVDTHLIAWFGGLLAGAGAGSHGPSERPSGTVRASG